MQYGFMYLTGIIDLYSRYMVGWQVGNTLDKQTQTEVLTQAMASYATPEIINADQGSQYTYAPGIDTLKDYHITISMNGKGRALDNVFIERWFRTIKQNIFTLIRHAMDWSFTGE
jgi:putative transposase